MSKLEALDVSTLDAAEVRRALDVVARLDGFLAATRVGLQRRLRELHAGGGGPRAELVIGQSVGRTEAGRIARRAQVLSRMAAVERALRAGVVTPAHVDALAGAVKRTPRLVDLDRQLAGDAVRMTPDVFREHVALLAMLHADDGGLSTFERQRRDTRLRIWADREGVYQLHGQLDPERGAQLLAALTGEVERQHHAGGGVGLEHDQRLAIALHRLATRAGDGATISTTLNVHVDERTLVDGYHPGSHADLDGGGLVPVETLHRHGCDNPIRTVVLDRDGVAVNIGRTRRLATVAQRAALRAMHPTCAVPGCEVRFASCKIHHRHWWRHGGRTDLDNMAPLCEQHHRDAHEGGWQLTIGPGRQIGWTRPPPPGAAA